MLRRIFSCGAALFNPILVAVFLLTWLAVWPVFVLSRRRLG
jgi:hypothetical protein